MSPLHEINPAAVALRGHLCRCAVTTVQQCTSNDRSEYTLHLIPRRLPVGLDWCRRLHMASVGVASKHEIAFAKVDVDE